MSLLSRIKRRIGVSGHRDSRSGTNAHLPRENTKAAPAWIRPRPSTKILRPFNSFAKLLDGALHDSRANGPSFVPIGRVIHMRGIFSKVGRIAFQDQPGIGLRCFGGWLSHFLRESGDFPLHFPHSAFPERLFLTFWPTSSVASRCETPLRRKRTRVPWHAPNPG